MSIRSYDELEQAPLYYFGVDEYEQRKHMSKFSTVAWSYSEEVDYLTEDLLQMAIDDKLIRYTTQREQYQDTLKAILCNSIKSVLTTRQHITVSLNKSTYTGIPNRYNPVGITSRVFINLLEWLAKNDFIDLYKAPKGSQVNIRSVFIVTSKLREYIHGYEIKLVDIDSHRGSEPIELRRAKKLADYDDNESIHEARVSLKRYESLLNSHKTKIAINGELTQSTRVTRKFSEELTKHGRIYSGYWQNCKSDNRKTITINDEETVEIDIVNCSLRMVLHLKDIDIEGDLYKIKDYPREIVKGAINRLLNTKGVKSTSQGFHNVSSSLQEKYQQYELKYLRTLVEDCYSHYHYIADEYFLQGRGLDLQYLDSKICLNVIEEFTNINEVVLTVHDSFIVRKELEEQLQDSITRHYEEIIGQKPILR